MEGGELGAGRVLDRFTVFPCLAPELSVVQCEVGGCHNSLSERWCLRGEREVEEQHTSENFLRATVHVAVSPQLHAAFGVQLQLTLAASFRHGIASRLRVSTKRLR